MPTTAHEEDEVDSIYAVNLQKKNQNIKNEFVIVMGDWNASAGEGVQEKCVGKCGLQKRNESAETR